MTVTAGAQDVLIGVRITNDVELCAMVIPLEIRAVTPGSFINSMALSYGGRLDSVMTHIVIANQFFAKDSACQGHRPGFGGVPFKEIGASHPISSSPVGALFFRIGFVTANLLPGTDTTPSVRVKVNVTAVPGTFEIDTACIALSNHLIFATSCQDQVRVLPTFTKGVVTIAACNCAHHGDLNGDDVLDVLDLSFLIDYVFGGYPIPPTDQGCPHIDRGDVNCHGGDDVFDVIYLNDYLFSSGPAPCDPCTCSPYPTNCP
ncbi:MAG: hypothetical protein HZB43_02515 [candidate division Zixibacteria bacterium]|nr:hypothetical protein [candidate division Zixibacteria bacterium]